MIFQSNYRKLNKIIPIKEIKAGFYCKLQSHSYMPLTIEYISNDNETITIAMAHNYIQEGDVMALPDMMIKIYPTLEACEALTYQNDALGIYQEVYPIIDNKKMVSKKLRSELNSFLGQWLSNIINQGFRYNNNKAVFI